MNDLGDLSKKLKKLGDRLERNAKNAVKKAALAVDQTVVMATPVDTGRARSNWLVSLDVPRGDSIDAYSAGTSLGTGEMANATAALDHGGRVIGTFTNGSIYISNNLAYTRRLNEGSSAQAPAGFIEMAVKAGRTVIKGVKLLNG